MAVFSAFNLKLFQKQKVNVICNLIAKKIDKTLSYCISPYVSVCTVISCLLAHADRFPYIHISKFVTLKI